LLERRNGGRKAANRPKALRDLGRHVEEPQRSLAWHNAIECARVAQHEPVRSEEPPAIHVGNAIGHGRATNDAAQLEFGGKMDMRKAQTNPREIVALLAAPSLAGVDQQRATEARLPRPVFDRFPAIDYEPSPGLQDGQRLHERPIPAATAEVMAPVGARE